MNTRTFLLKIEGLIDELRAEDLDKIFNYAYELSKIDHEALDVKEQQAVQTLGYNPTSQISDWEWEAQLKRNQLSLEKESKK